MKIILTNFLFVGALVSTNVFAKSMAPEISATEARILVPMNGTTVTAAYAVLKNNSAEAISLVITQVKPFTAVELHETYETAGKMGMRKIEKVLIPAHQSFELKPGGNHIMLFDPTDELKAGEIVDVNLSANGKAITLKFKVVDRSETSVPSHH